jgi:histidine ammonia-lyase
MAQITFTKVSDVRVTVKDGTALIGGFSIYTNIFVHPLIDAIILTNDANSTNTLNGRSNGTTIYFQDVVSPVGIDKNDLANILATTIFI